MNKVRLDSSGAGGILSLANPPLNLFDQKLIDDLRTTVNHARQLPLRVLLVRADAITRMLRDSDTAYESIEHCA